MSQLTFAKNHQLFCNTTPLFYQKPTVEVSLSQKVLLMVFKHLCQTASYSICTQPIINQNSRAASTFLTPVLESNFHSPFPIAQSVTKAIPCWRKVFRELSFHELSKLWKLNIAYLRRPRFCSPFQRISEKSRSQQARDLLSP